MIPAVPAHKSWFNVPKTPGGAAADRSAKKFGAPPSQQADQEPIRAIASFEHVNPGHPDWALDDERRLAHQDHANQPPVWDVRQHGIAPGSIGYQAFEQGPWPADGRIRHTWMEPAATSLLHHIAHWSPRPEMQAIPPEERDAWLEKEIASNRGLATPARLFLDHPAHRGYALLTDRDLAGGWAAPYFRPSEDADRPYSQGMRLIHPDDFEPYYGGARLRQREGQDWPPDSAVGRTDRMKAQLGRAWQQHAQPLDRWIGEHTLHPGHYFDGGPQPPAWHLSGHIPGHRIILPDQDIVPHLAPDATANDYLKALDKAIRSRGGGQAFPLEELLARTADFGRRDPFEDLTDQAKVYRNDEEPGYRDREGQWQPGNWSAGFRRSYAQPVRRWRRRR